MVRDFIKDSPLKTGELLNLSRNQLQTMMGMLRGHHHLKGHPFKQRPVNNPQCNRCK